MESARVSFYMPRPVKVRPTNRVLYNDTKFCFVRVRARERVQTHTHAQQRVTHATRRGDSIQEFAINITLYQQRTKRKHIQHECDLCNRGEWGGGVREREKCYHCDLSFLQLVFCRNNSQNQVRTEMKMKTCTPIPSRPKFVGRGKGRVHTYVFTCDCHSMYRQNDWLVGCFTDTFIFILLRFESLAEPYIYTSVLLASVSILHHVESICIIFVASVAM